MFSADALSDLHIRNDVIHNVCGVHAVAEYFRHVRALAGIEDFGAGYHLYVDLLFRLDSSI